jgi:hypothetical protein
VRWDGLDFTTDRLQHAGNVAKDVIVPKADDTVAMLGEFAAARGISVCLRCVLTAIEFDRDFARRTREVGNESTDRMLATEPERHLAFVQCPPEEALRVGVIAAESPRDQGSWS